MDQRKPHKFFKAYVNHHSYKVFLEDVSVIYKVALRKTPPSIPYFNPSKHIVDDTD